MTRNTGFDNEKYLVEQSAAILDRLERLGVNLTSEPNFSTKDLFTA